MGGFRRTGEQLLHEGPIWRVVVASFEAPDGSAFHRDIVRSPGAVGVLPLRFDAEGQAVISLVCQYRPAFEDQITEVPAGMRDVPGEATEATAHRELAEEMGLVADRLELLGRIIPSPGMSDAVTHLYLATGLHETDRDAQGPEEAHMHLLHLPLDEALTMVDDGRILDAKTVTALLLLERRMARGDAV